MNDAQVEILLKAKDQTAKTLKTFQGRIQAITGSVLSLKGGLGSVAGVYGFQQLVTSLTATGKQVARLDKAYAEITGSAAAAGQEFDFLRTTSDQLGQNFYVLADVYKGFAAASKGTNLEGQATRDIFKAVTRASASLGLSSENTRGRCTPSSK